MCDAKKDVVACAGLSASQVQSRHNRNAVFVSEENTQFYLESLIEWKLVLEDKFRFDYASGYLLLVNDVDGRREKYRFFKVCVSEADLI